MEGAAYPIVAKRWIFVAWLLLGWSVVASGGQMLQKPYFLASFGGIPYALEKTLEKYLGSLNPTS